MARGSRGLLFLSAAYNLWKQWIEKWRSRATTERRSHPIFLLAAAPIMWVVMKRMDYSEQQKVPRILLESALKVEALCKSDSRIKGALLSSSELICVLVQDLELDCKDSTILIKRSQFRQLPLNKLSFLKNTRFVEKVPIGVEPCKNVKKIYYESW